MKPIQEAIATIKEYRDVGDADVDTCNTILLHLASMLEKEEYTMGLLLNFILVNYETSYQEGFCFTNANGEEVTISEILEHFYNEKFNTKER